MNPWLYPLFALLFSVALMGYILDRQGYRTVEKDEEGNETHYPVYKMLIEGIAGPIIFVYLLVLVLVGWMSIPWLLSR